MATRTVRLDDEAEEALDEIVRATRLPISEVLKRGLRAVREQVRHESSSSPYDLYRTLDLGPGGYAIAPARNVREGVAAALKRKHRR